MVNLVTGILIKVLIMAEIVTQLYPVEPDLEKAFAFLQLLDPDASTFHFQAYHEDKGNKSALAIEGSLYDVSEKLLSYNDTRHSILSLSA